jgi:hypothetical protein
MIVLGTTKVTNHPKNSEIIGSCSYVASYNQTMPISRLVVSFIHDFGSVTLLFYETPISGMWSENSGVMLPKSRTEANQGRHQITHNGCYSYDTIFGRQN